MIITEYACKLLGTDYKMGHHSMMLVIDHNPELPRTQYIIGNHT
jgi:hypothetical protein